MKSCVRITLVLMAFAFGAILVTSCSSSTKTTPTCNGEMECKDGKCYPKPRAK